MDRLIKSRIVHENGDVEYTVDVGKITVNKHGDGLMRRVLDRLWEYEQAEEHGRLVVLPCKVGDTLCCVDGDESGDFVDEYEVKYFYASSHGINRIYCTNGTLSKNFRPKQIGKTVFLTREEAEAALATVNNVGHKGGNDHA